MLDLERLFQKVIKSSSKFKQVQASSSATITNFTSLPRLVWNVCNCELSSASWVSANSFALPLHRIDPYFLRDC